MVAFIALIFSILAFLLSLSNIRVPMFNERYQIYIQTRDYFLKLLDNNRIQLSSKFTIEDRQKVVILLQRSEFIFNNDKEILRILEELNKLIQYYSSNPHEEYMNESRKGAGNNSSAMATDFARRYDADQINIQNTIDTKEIENAFRYHLNISYNPLTIIRWDGIQRSIRNFFTNLRNML